MKPLVLFHGGCWDGFCAAWIARKALGDIEAIPVQYGQDPPIKECGRDVYILDFNYPRSTMRDIIGQSNSVVVLDHHKTAQAELDGLAEECNRESLGAQHPTIIFDMNKSGGRLAWEYFFQRVEPFDPAPWLVDYTEDRDLWRWALPSSHEINAALRSYPLDFELWDTWSVPNDPTHVTDWQGMLLNRLADEGTGILRRERQIIDDHIRHAREIEMAGQKILAVNATVLSSEIAGELARDRPFGACYFINDEGKRIWSLRSRDGGVDVSAIAKAHGGGGHKNAAGFQE